MLGAERLLYCRLGAETLVVRTDESLGLAPDLGSTLYVQPKEGRVHWFDGKTGLRMVVGNSR